MAEVGGNNVHLVSHVLPTLVHWKTDWVPQLPTYRPFQWPFALVTKKLQVKKKTVEKSHTTGRLIRYPCYIPTHSLTPCAALLVTTSKNPMSENHENV